MSVIYNDYLRDMYSVIDEAVSDQISFYYNGFEYREDEPKHNITIDPAVNSHIKSELSEFIDVFYGFDNDMLVDWSQDYVKDGQYRGTLLSYGEEEDLRERVIGRLTCGFFNDDHRDYSEGDQTIFDDIVDNYIIKPEDLYLNEFYRYG